MENIEEVLKEYKIGDTVDIECLELFNQVKFLGLSKNKRHVRIMIDRPNMYKPDKTISKTIRIPIKRLTKIAKEEPLDEKQEILVKESEQVNKGIPPEDLGV